MQTRKVQRTLYVDEIFDRKLKAKAALAGVDKSDLYELGARMLLAVLEAGRIPDDLGYILQKYDATALEELRKIVEAARG